MRISRALVLALLGLVSPAWADMTLTGGIMLVKEGGTGHPTASNIALGKTAFAQDEIGVAPHAIAKVNDGVSGNGSSWIAGTQNSFVGINLGASAVPVRCVAFARDDTGNFNDRTLGLYEVEYTMVPNPDQSTTSWTSIGTMNYQAVGGANYALPSRRHVFNLPSTVMATGIRLKVNATTAFDLTCVDELEIYSQAYFEGVALVSQGGTFVAGNMAATGTAFAKDEFGSGHTTAKLNDGTYGNASSWIGSTMDSFAGISLGSTPATLTSVAFGRDNQGAYTDRWQGVYTLQVTTVPNPTAATPDGSWTTVGILDYSNLEQVGNFTLPARRHVWSLPSVQATGFRIKTFAPSEVVCLDEIELYGTPGVSADANLSALTASTGALSPAFDSGTTSYTLPAVLYATSSLTITPTAAAAAVTVQVNGSAVTSGSASGSIPLSVGSNAITVLVTATDGTTTRSYTINVTRQSAAYSDASLSALGVVAHSLSTAFESNTTNYSVTALSYDQSSLRFTATATETGAVVRVNGGILPSGIPSEPITMAPGDNTVTVQVTAEDGVTTRAYTVQAFRPGNPRLSAFSSSAGTLTYPLDPATTDYHLSLVPYSTSSVMVTVTAAQADATLVLDAVQPVTSGVPFNVPLMAGFPTTVALRVSVPQSLDFRTYHFTFNRASEAQSDASLSGLTASTGAVSPAFDSATTSYTLPAVPNSVTSLNVTPTIFRAGATVRVNGTLVSSGTPSPSIPLNLGANTITVLVTASDGMTTRTYTVNVTRAAVGPLISVSDASGVYILQNGGPQLELAARYAQQTVTNLRITNVGDAPLTNINAEIVPVGALFGNFSTSLINGFTLAPGENTTFTISNYIQSTEDRATITLRSGTSNTPEPFVIHLRAMMLCHVVRLATENLPPFLFRGLPATGRFDGFSLDDGPPYTFRLAGGQFPPGITMSVAGALSGTPTQPGLYSCNVQVIGSFECASTGDDVTYLRVYEGRVLSEGGSHTPRNLASTGIAFAKDDIGVAPHAVSKVNDGMYGNSSSWIAGSATSFVGINLGASLIKLDRVAWGRDNTNTATDRWEGGYKLQYTTVPNPDASTVDAAWITIENYDAVYYIREGGPLTIGSLRHVWQFPEVQATGFRIGVQSSDFVHRYIAIDELELYGPDPAPAWRTQHFGAATANIGDLDDFDGDGIANLLEFALGTLPNNAARGPLSFNGNVITPGQPVSDGTNAVFIRRKGYIAAGLVYTVDFSPDLRTWTVSTATPTVLADDGTHEVVSVPMPALQSRHFFRVEVRSTP